MDSGAKGVVWTGLAIAKVGSTTLDSGTVWSGIVTLDSCEGVGVSAILISCTDGLGTAGCTTLGSVRGAGTSGGEVAAFVGEVHGSAKPVCREARASRSWMRVGGMKLPVRLKCFKCTREILNSGNEQFCCVR